jgi:hypothetical protein
MRVRMVTRIAGPGLNAAPGDVVEVDAVLGLRLVDGGYAVEEGHGEQTAVPLRQPGEVETAEARPVEQAVTRKGRARGARARKTR